MYAAVYVIKTDLGSIYMEELISLYSLRLCIRDAVGCVIIT